MDWTTAVPWIVALGGGAGIGAGVKALIDVILLLRSGVKASEGRRKADIVLQRDEALRKAASAEARAERAERRAEIMARNAEVARRNETRAREHAAELRVLAIRELGKLRSEIPAWPDMEPFEDTEGA